MARRQRPTPHFGPLLNERSYGGPETIIETLAHLGCFNQQESCGCCGSPVRLELSRTKKVVGGMEKCYVSGRMRCSKKDCRVVISLFENTIWAEIGDLTLFICTVGCFLERRYGFHCKVHGKSRGCHIELLPHKKRVAFGR